MSTKIHAKALVHFDTIRRCGSIRQAARQLHLSSSALNRQLLELEAQMGAPLFERMNTGLQLTATGEVLARHVIHVLQDAQRMSLELESMQGLQTGHVNLITVEALTRAFVPGLLDQMAVQHPRVTATVRIAGSRKAAEEVIDGAADVAISFLSQRNLHLRQVAAASFAVGAIVQPGHPLAGHASVSFAQCAEYPLALPTPEISIYETLEPLIRAHAGPLHTVMQTSSFELMKQTARQGRGVAFVNTLGVEEELGQGALVHLPLKKTPPSVLGIYVRSGRSLPPAIERFCLLATERLRQLQET